MKNTFFPLLKLPDEPTEVELTRDTKLDGADLDRFIESGGVVKPSGYCVFIAGAVSFKALNSLAPAKVVEHVPGRVTVTDVNAPLAIASGLRLTGADVDVPNGGSGPVLLIERVWNQGDRVRVVRGEHEGRTGTISILPSSPYARYLKLGPGDVQVALDGEPGHPDGTGGRGGQPIVVGSDDLETYDGPAGIAISKKPR